MKFKKFLPIIGIFLLVYLIYKIGLISLFNTIKYANLFYILLGLILTPVFILPLGYKWYKILKLQGFTNINFYYIMKLYYIGAFYGFITPARAGSLIRAYYLKEKTKKGLIECASSIVIERILDLLTIFSIAFVGSLIFLNKSDVNVTSLLIISFITLLILIFIFMRKSRGIFILSFIYNYLLPKNIREKADTSLNQFYDSLPKLRKLIFIFSLTILTWVGLYFQTYIFAIAFHINVPFHIFMTFSSIGTIIATLPISISGLGTRELTLITLFSLYNVTPESIISMSLSSFFGIGLIEALTGLFFIYKGDKNEILDYNTISP